MPDSNETLAFLSTLFHAKDDALWFNVWTLQDKKASWFTDVSEATKYISECNGDVYIGTALFKEKPKEGRGTRQQVDGIVGFTVDFDIQGGKIPSQNEVLKLIDDVGLSPTILVHSGHGIHAHWILKESYIFDDKKERDDITLVAKMFCRTFQIRGSIQGYIIDSAYGTERVWRIPGTLNYKTIPFAEVKIISLNDALYSIDDIREISVSEDIVTGSIPINKDEISILSIDLDTPFPQKKHEQLYDNNRMYRMVYDRKNQMVQRYGDDDSRYDMAIARYCAEDESSIWTPSEIAAIIKWNRNKWTPNDSKNERVDYYERTIGKVLADVRGKLEKEVPPSIVTESIKRAPDKLSGISKLLGVNITEILHYMNDDPFFELTIESNEIVFDAGDLLSFRKFMQRVFLYTGKLIKIQPKNEFEWREFFMRPMMESAHVVIDPVKDQKGRFVQDILEYVKTGVVEIYNDAYSNTGGLHYNPDKGEYYIRSEGFMKYLQSQNRIVSMNDARRILRSVCGTVRNVNIKLRSDTWITHSVYVFKSNESIKSQK